MTDKINTSDTASDTQPGSVRVGRESLSKVFRSDGGSELSSHHNTRLTSGEKDTLSGPRLLNEITDGAGPKDTRDIDPSIPGPSLNQALNDSAGPSDLREMHDAEGPIVPRKALEDHHYRQGKLDLSSAPLQAHTAPAIGSEAPAEQATTIHLDTYSIHMEDRLAKVKASQKETLEKMKLLQDGEAPAPESVKNIEPSTDAEHVPTMKTLPSERHLLPLSSIHRSIRTTIAGHHRDIVDEAIRAIDSHQVVVIGMGGNPFVSRARKLLDQKAIGHHYLGYGNYLSGWRRRNALKLWTGWPTFPMIFIRGVLIGGYQELRALAREDALEALLRD